MSKKVFFLFLICSSFSAYACVDNARVIPQWSFGVIGYGHFNMPVSGANNYFLPGIQLAHNSTDGRWSQRVAFEYIKQAVVSPEFPPGSADMMTMEGQEKRALLRIGLERGWSLHRLFHPYVAMDIAGQLYTSDVTYSGGIAGLYQRTEVSAKGIGLLPAAGFKTFLGQHIALYAEYRAEAFVNDVHTKTTDYIGNVDYRPTSETQSDFKGGDIFLAGIQVIF